MQPLVADVDGTKFQRNTAMPNPVQQLADVVLRLRNQFLDQQSAALMQKANQPETDDAVRLDLLRQQQHLRSLKRQPLNPIQGP
jgi:hypothetical protein